MSLRLQEDLPAGSSALFTLEPSTWTIGGRTLASKRRTATVTIGGTLAITDVVPAGATFPAGTVISVRGVGFDGDTRLRLNGDRLDDAEVISPNEIQFTLTRADQHGGRGAAGRQFARRKNDLLLVPARHRRRRH